MLTDEELCGELQKVRSIDELLELDKKYSAGKTAAGEG
jgi:hypothetical protein